MRCFLGGALIFAATAAASNLNRRDLAHSRGNFCEASPAGHDDCGFVGIDEGGCVNKGCCWKPNNEGPWCWHPGKSPSYPWKGYNADKWEKRTIYQVLTDRFAKEGDQNQCNNLGNYCGGTYKGLISKLDYIQGMGFDALWISPVIENTDGGYHGYWAKNLNSYNTPFGSEEELRELIEECHKRNIYIMIDVVANHMGNQPNRDDFSMFEPFNKPEHYHNYCDINDWNNYGQVEQCRLAGLPDLNQDNTWVRDQLKNWIKKMVTDFKVDGLRIDTIPEVKHEFWYEFVESAGVFAIGEVFNGDMNYVASYQKVGVPSVLHYPMYYTLHDVFQRSRSMHAIIQTQDEAKQKFVNTDVLGVFVDNHDNARFLSQQRDWNLYKSSLAYVLLGKHLPLVYYGTEQAFSGTSDPQNRESLWPHFDTNHQLYQFMSKVNKAKQRLGDSFYNSQFQNNYVDDQFMSFSRGNMVVLITNVGSYASDINRSFRLNQQQQVNEQYCNIFDDNDKVYVNNNQMDIQLKNGLPKVYVPCNQMQESSVNFVEVNKVESGSDSSNVLVIGVGIGAVVAVVGVIGMVIFVKTRKQYEYTPL